MNQNENEKENEKEEGIYLEQKTRLGRVIITIFNTYSTPIGFFNLDPEEYDYIIKDINESVNNWESIRRQREEKSRLKRNGNKVEGDAY